MSLAAILTEIRGIESLPPLGLELGFQPTWHELELGGLGLARATPSAAAVVGRRDRFLALGVAANPGQSAAVAPAVAAALARRGTVALVLALDAAERTLAVSVTVAEPPSLVMSLTAPALVALRILERGRRQGGETPLERCWHWAEALAGESLGQRFFRRFHDGLETAIGLWPTRMPRRIRHRLALLDLTRVLFLYFVQERGWLDGRPRFLREELDRCLTSGGRVAQRYLRPLFFGTLNRRPETRGATARRFGRIPFLNGGLFEPHPLEADRSELPDEFWRASFDDLFEHYHFTIGRESVDPGKIGPDMLGRVFEGVMDPDERRSTGAFYTPTALVDQLLAAALRHALGPDALAAPKASLERIRRLTVLDPAVGSGAFLLRALEQLVGLRVAAGEERAAATREVLTENLFGVDLNPAAVQLTELRLWLALIDATPDLDIELVAPLPNLDVSIRQGDSIFERIELPIVVGGAEAAALARLRRDVALATGADKRRAVQSLRRVEVAAARVAVENGITTVEARIEDLIAARRSPTLFGDRAGQTATTRRGLAVLRRQRARLRAMDRQLRESHEVPWFSYSSHFADVMGEGGFDMVVGNPPWVRGEALAPIQREALKLRYRWFRGAGRRGGFAPVPDLSVAFLERAFELVRPGGVVAQILPAKLLTTRYGAAAREAIARGTTIRVVANLSEGPHGFDATVYPLAFVAERRVPAGNAEAATGFADGSPTVSQASLGAAPWPLGPQSVERLAAATSHFPRLRERITCRLGVKTGADRIFLDPPVHLEPELLRPAIRGRDVSPFIATATRHLVWTHGPGGEPRAELPAAATRYFAGHARTLTRRTDYRGGPAWTVFRTEGASARYRVVWTDLARRLQAVALITPALRSSIPLNTCYLAALDNAGEAVALAGWLNSAWIRRLARRTATPAASGFARFDAATVGELPLPTGVLTDGELIALSELAHHGRIDQAAIDQRAGALLGLSAMEQQALEAALTT